MQNASRAVAALITLALCACTNESWRAATLAPPLEDLTPVPRESTRCAHLDEVTPLPTPVGRGIRVQSTEAVSACGSLATTAIATDRRDMIDSARSVLTQAQAYLDDDREIDALTVLVLNDVGWCWLNKLLRDVRDYPDSVKTRDVVDDCLLALNMGEQR